jgi:precorrin-6B C5,15-methyltransferase / cobalt-precorrin-6B C5,C15-methyltransferase
VSGITVIGCDGSPLRPEAAAALDAAALVAGAPRHLDSVQVPPGAQRVEIKALDNAIDTICAAQGNVAVLASGDPGFFGIVRALRARGVAVRVIPAVSSVALAFALLGMNWDDALVISAHGRDRGRALAAALAHHKAAILTAPGTAAWLVAELAGAGRRVYVAECLGSPRERVTEVTEVTDEKVTGEAGDTGEAVTAAFADPNIVIAVDRYPQTRGAPGWLAGHRGPEDWALPESDFAHRDSMITKAEVRALVLARLGPAPGRTIWDIGAGSGSVGVECARFGAWVTAVERAPDQCRRIRENATRHGVTLRVIEGAAPDVLSGLSAADAIFVGGGGNDVLGGAIDAGSPGRVVVTLATVERVGEVTRLLIERGYRADGVQLQAARLAAMANGTHRLDARNPVFVVWGERQ